MTLTNAGVKGANPLEIQKPMYNFWLPKNETLRAYRAITNNKQSNSYILYVMCIKYFILRIK